MWILLYFCPATSTVNIQVSLGTSRDEFADASTRMFCEAGLPNLLLIDRHSGLMKMTDNVEFFVSDVQGKVSKVAGLNTQLTPVSGHNFHGKARG